MPFLQPTVNQSLQRRRWLGSALAGAAGLLLWPGLAQAAVDPATVAEPKRTKAERYLMAADVPAFIQARGGADKVLFIDLRTRAEAMYVGMAQGIDALVPFVEHQELMTDWDAQRGIYRLEPLQDFVPEVNRRLAQKGLAKTDTVVLICRSGDRSGPRRQPAGRRWLQPGVVGGRRLRGRHGQGRPAQRQWVEERRAALELQAGARAHVFPAMSCDPP